MISGVWLARLLIVDHLNPTLQEATDSLINLIAIAIIAWIIYRAAPLLGQLLRNLSLQTETELDDLVVPYLPKLFQAIAIAIVFLKVAEVVLGASAGALIGLIGIQIYSNKGTN